MARAAKSQYEGKIVLTFSKFMKRPQTKFHAHTMREFQVIRSKKSKFTIGSNFSCSTVYFYRYFIEATTTDIDMNL